MARDGSGVYSLPVGTTAVANTTIESSKYNAALTDIASALTDSLPRAGTAPMTAALPMGGFKVTGLGTPTDTTDATTKAYVDATDYLSAATVLAKLLTVDGSGSGLDADLLDGLNSSAFAQLNSSPTFTGTVTGARVGFGSGYYAEIDAGNPLLALDTNDYLTYDRTANILYLYVGGVPTDLTASPIKAWVNFNGTGTVAIRASQNVSSITDIGTGQYDVNFTSALSDTSYAVTGAIGGPDTYRGEVTYGITGTGNVPEGSVYKTVSLCRINTAVSGGLTDFPSVSLAFFR